jgi:hypothetical protein
LSLWHTEKPPKLRPNRRAICQAQNKKEAVVRIKAALCAVVLGLGSSPAWSQWAVPYDLMPPYEAARIVRSSGLVPVARPMRWGASYVVPATDRAGTPARVVVDGRSGQILSVRRTAAVQRPDYPYPDMRSGYRPYGPGAAYRDDMPYDDWQAGPGYPVSPGAVPGTVTVPQRPAALAPARPPVPRARPATAPAQAAHAAAETSPSASSASSDPAAPSDPAQSSGAPAQQPSADTPQKPAAAFPPVQSLE